MLKEFIDFVDSILPAVPMGTKEGVQDAIMQFEKNNEQIKYLTHSPLPVLSQGDVISAIPFYYFGSDGKQKCFTADAMVISTSCHIDQKKRMILAPVLPLNQFEGNIVELKKNKIIDYMYIPDGKLNDKYIDFGVMNTFSKELIFNGINNKKIQRIESLNQIGYYFFVVKLTVYLLRKEDVDTLHSRNKGFDY